MSLGPRGELDELMAYSAAHTGLRQGEQFALTVLCCSRHMFVRPLARNANTEHAPGRDQFPVRLSHIRPSQLPGPITLHACTIT
jgi:hypothetical protein